jgi:hypothetical protein
MQIATALFGKLQRIGLLILERDSTIDKIWSDYNDLMEKTFDDFVQEHNFIFIRNHSSRESRLFVP